MLARHLLSILILPFTMAVLVPRWLLSARTAGDRGWPADSPVGGVAAVLGGIVLLAGSSLFAWCVLLFARIGRGTLAPWDPTKALVAVGPYRYVRNPMITGVATMLAGESLLFGSRAIATWLAIFVAFNHLYFLTIEEPGLEQRFGSSYEEYKAAVPRWLPRIVPRTGPR